MKIRFKKNGGITLVALIITIIIMLILVAVSVNVIVKSNLIGTAEKAADGYKTAQEKESNGTITINGKTYASVDDYLAGIEEKHNWQYTDATRGAIRCTCAECKAFNDGDTEGRTIAIGAQIGEAETINSSVTVTAAETGYDTDQIITASGAVKWVVLGYEDQNNNGTNETLLLTTDTVIGDILWLKGATAYNNAVDTKEKDGVITKVCKGLYGENVRSMKIEDVNRAMGYDEEPKGMKIVLDRSTNTWLYSIIDTTKNKKLSELGDTWEALKASTDSDGKLYTPEHPEGMATGTEEEKAIAEENLGKYEVDGYAYSVVADSLPGAPVIDSNISSVAKTLIFGNNDIYYWLASRGVKLVDLTDIGYLAIFGPGAVGGGEADSSSGNYNEHFFSSSGLWFWGIAYVRPVVSLTSAIPAVEEVV